MKHIIIICLLSSLLPISLLAQAYNSLSYDIEGFSDLGKVIIDLDGEHLLLGIGSLCEGDKSCFTLIKTNWEGSIIWQKRYHTYPFSIKSSRIVQNQDKTFTTVGFRVVEDEHGQHHDMFMMKFSETGDSLWTKTYNGAKEDFGDDCIPTKDGGHIVSCVKNSHNKTSTKRDICLLKTDSLGTIIWEQIYETPDYSETTRNLEADIDGGFILGGYRSLGNREYQSLVIKTDSVGNQLWERSYGLVNEQRVAHIIPRQTGGYWMTAPLKVDSLFEGQTYPYQQIVAQLDQDGFITDALFFPANYEQEHRFMLELQNGDVLIIGVERDNPAFEHGSSTKGWAARVSPDLELIWEKSYAYEAGVGLCYFVDAIETAAGDLLITGQNTDTTYTELVIDSFTYVFTDYDPNAWLLKLDRDGCFKEACDDKIFVGIEDGINIPSNPHPFVLNGSLVPNPFSQQVHIQLNNLNASSSYQLIITDIVGRIIDRQSLLQGQSELQIEMEKQAAGIYLFSLWEKGTGSLIGSIRGVKGNE